MADGSESPDVEHARCGLAYRRNGRGPAVVLVHGVPGSSASWSGVVENLSLDHDVIVPDLLGFGASSRPESIDDLAPVAQAAAVGHLLRELGIRSVSLVGHDVGGLVAASVWEQHPERVRSLTLVSCGASTEIPVPFPRSSVRWPLIGRPCASLVFGGRSLNSMLIRGTASGARRPDPEFAIGDRRQRRAIGTILRELVINADVHVSPIEAGLGRLDVARSLVWGARDPLVPLEYGTRLATRMGVRPNVLPDAGHFLPDERPRDVAYLVRRLVAVSGGVSAVRPMRRSPRW